MRTLRQAILPCSLSISIILSGGLVGCRKPQAKLVAGVGSASFEAPSSLFTALAIENQGEATAEDVQVDTITLAGATLVLPTSLPSSIGSIPTDGNAALNANFTSAAAKP